MLTREQLADQTRLENLNVVVNGIRLARVVFGLRLALDTPLECVGIRRMVAADPGDLQYAITLLEEFARQIDQHLAKP